MRELLNDPMASWVIGIAGIAAAAFVSTVLAINGAPLVDDNFKIIPEPKRKPKQGLNFELLPDLLWIAGLLAACWVLMVLAHEFGMRL